ncbi:hypothetical protein P8S54_03160 [Thiomicrospira sp. R3]|uniref:hypothetical protein n=1 Tax=Thiomicrospira sp. R3 TaxID=3035472 RepID=UPI00259BB5B2|nr:hypothetical protein [Thiomicrospira sp. R3]WFE69308.1 hypothetical protein P8S54_03160 [Thiomicrospira sp. R3]
MEWQEHIDFLHAWPELHSLLAAYIAIEDDDDWQAVSQFVLENPKAVGRLKTQLIQLTAASNPALWQQAAQLAGRPAVNQAWLESLLTQLDQEGR